MKEIQLRSGYVTIVDEADYEYLSLYKWYPQVYICTDGHIYVSVHGYKHTVDVKRKYLRMHRVILDAPVGTLVDHIDGNALNNRRTNLRLCTNAQNQQNRRPSKKGSSIYKGVWEINNQNSEGKIYR